MATKSICDDCRFLGSESKYDFKQYYCKGKKEWMRPDKVSKCDKYREVKKDAPEPELKAEIEVPQHIKDKAKEIMEKGDPVDFLFKTHQKEHVGDELISKTLIIGVGVQSANNTSGIQPKLDGASGKGKSHSAKTFMKFIPEDYIINGSISDKVLFYKNDMKDGTVVYSDDISISEDMTTTIKRATTNFQEKTAHYTLNREREPETHYLPKRIMWLLTSVENNQSMQLLNRQFGGSVDESVQQDEHVFDYQVQSSMLGKVDSFESDDVLVCREIIKDIKSKLFTVIIPYSYLIEWKNKDNRRNFTMFTDMIAGFAVYRYKQREVHDNYLFADLKDFDDAHNLYCQRNVNQRTKLTDTELMLCRYLEKVTSADVKAIQAATGLSPTRISQLMNGKTDTDSGLLFKVNGLSEEEVSVDTEVGEMGRDKKELSIEVKSSGKARKKVYTLTGFCYDEYAESVVSIGDTERNEYQRINHDLTTTLLLKIDNGLNDLTYLTKFNNIHSNGKFVNRLFAVLNPQNRVKRVKSLEPIAKDDSKVDTKLGVKLTSEIVEYIKKEYKHMNKPDNEHDLSYRIMSATSDIKRHFDISNQEAHKFFKDYCKARGWE